MASAEGTVEQPGRRFRVDDMSSDAVPCCHRPTQAAQGVHHSHGAGRNAGEPARPSCSPIKPNITFKPTSAPCERKWRCENALNRPEPGRKTTVGSPCVATGRGAMTRVPSASETL